jgi:hypothetical protein
MDIKIKPEIMKERPISFSPKLIQQIKGGNKTMTRRRITLPDFLSEVANIFFDPLNDDWVLSDNVKDFPLGSINCPHGEPDDLLWIREEHMIYHSGNDWYCEFRDGTIIHKYYKQLPLTTLQNLTKRKTLGKWQRARFLPKSFARTWLKITDIKAEHLASISSADAIAEGIESYGEEPLKFYNNYFVGKDFLYDSEYGFNYGKEIQSAPVASFCTLWISIYGHRTWLANPWVWVITFEPIIKPESNG